MRRAERSNYSPSYLTYPGDEMANVNWSTLLFATAATVLLWLAVVWGRSLVNNGRKEFNPLRLTQGPFGRASLSNLQLFFFLMIVVWIVLYVLIDTHLLTRLSSDVLTLLGIGAAGTAGGKATAMFRRRISSGNWAWLREKEWIRQSLEKKRDEGPNAGDLVSTDGQFDVTKFQVLAFSLIVGISLVLTGLADADALEKFSIDQNYLTLIGLSQVVYVGGKAITPPTNSQLEQEITKLRNLEVAFMEKVAEAWQATPPETAGMAAAKSVALTKYMAYCSAAAVVTLLVAELTGDHRVRSIEPALPQV